MSQDVAKISRLLLDPAPIASSGSISTEAKGREAGDYGKYPRRRTEQEFLEHRALGKEGGLFNAAHGDDGNQKDRAVSRLNGYLGNESISNASRPRIDIMPRYRYV